MTDKTNELKDALSSLTLTARNLNDYGKVRKADPGSIVKAKESRPTEF